MHHIRLTVRAVLSVVLVAAMEATSSCRVARAQPATAPAEGEERVKIRVTEVVKSVRVRQTENEPFRAATVGMELDEGAEFQTGPGSRVRVAVPPDQVIAIDRLTTCKVIRARVAGGGSIARTDLGMQYGRTEYTVEAAGVEHDSSIRSPGATLAVRGTQNMSLFDHGPFVPEARASQPVRLRNFKGQEVRFGKAGRSARVTADANRPAETELTTTQGNVVPETTQTPAENYAVRFLSAFNFGNPGAAVFQSKSLNLVTSFPIERSLTFQLRWFNVPFADVDFVIVDPNGQTLSIKNLTTPSGGFFAGGNAKSGNGVASKSGFGAEAAIWPNGFPTGNYTLRARVANPANGGRVNIDLQFNIIQIDPTNTTREPVILTLNGSVPPKTGSTVTRTVFADTDVVREVTSPAAQKAKGGKATKAKKPETPKQRQLVQPVQRDKRR